MKSGRLSSQGLGLSLFRSCSQSCKSSLGSRKASSVNGELGTAIFPNAIGLQTTRSKKRCSADIHSILIGEKSSDFLLKIDNLKIIIWQRKFLSKNRNSKRRHLSLWDLFFL